MLQNAERKRYTETAGIKIVANKVSRVSNVRRGLYEYNPIIFVYYIQNP